MGPTPILRERALCAEMPEILSGPGLMLRKGLQSIEVTVLSALGQYVCCSGAGMQQCSLQS